MDFRLAKKKRLKRKRREEDEDYDYEAEVKKSRKTYVKAKSSRNLTHLRDLLKRSNFYANSLLHIITEQQKQRGQRLRRKLNAQKKRMKKTAKKIKKNYGKKCKRVPQVYTTFMESEDNQISFGEKTCFRVAISVSRLVKKVNKLIRDEHRDNPESQIMTSAAQTNAGTETYEVKLVMDTLLDTVCGVDNDPKTISASYAIQTKKDTAKQPENLDETPTARNDACLRNQKLNKCRRHIDMESPLEPLSSDILSGCRSAMQHVLDVICFQEDVKSLEVSHENEAKDELGKIILKDCKNPYLDTSSRFPSQNELNVDDNTKLQTGGSHLSTSQGPDDTEDLRAPNCPITSTKDCRDNGNSSLPHTSSNLGDEKSISWPKDVLTSCEVSENLTKNTALPAKHTDEVVIASVVDSQTEISVIKVPCPICCKLVKENRINEHLDICIFGGDRIESLRTKSNRTSSKQKRKVSKREEAWFASIVEPTTSKEQERTDQSEKLSKRKKKKTDSLIVFSETGSNSCCIQEASCASIPVEEITEQENMEPVKNELNALAKNETQDSLAKHEVKISVDKSGNRNQSLEASIFGKNMEDALTKDEVASAHDPEDDKNLFWVEKIVEKHGEPPGDRVNPVEDLKAKTEKSDLDGIIGLNEEMAEDPAESSSESENEEFIPPVEVRRSTRQSRCKKSFKECSDEEMEDEVVEEEDVQIQEGKKNKLDNDKKKQAETVENDLKKLTKEKYGVGDAIRVTWGQEEGGKLYKAKILDRCPTDDDDWTYLVHYIGWNEAFDDWIFTSDINCVLESYDDDAIRSSPTFLSCDTGLEGSLTPEEQALLDEKFYMPGICGISAPTSQLTTKNGIRYFKDLKVSPAQPKLFTGGALRGYQVTGYEWMKTLIENGENGILADEMGLGKTIQCIAIVCKMIEAGVRGPFLICAPMSTIQNWFLEFRRFSPKIPLLLYHGNASEREMLSLCILQQERKLKARPVVITTYDVLMRDRMVLQVHDWSYMIIDEGHRIKNLKCRLLKELRQIPAQAKLLLTGTPLQNNLSELWSLLNFLLPEVFDDLKTFETWFDTDRLKKDQNLLSMIHKILTPFLLRRMKSDVDLTLPPKKEVVVYAPLAPKQERFYRGLVDQSIRELLDQKEYYNTTLGVADPDLIAQKQNSQELVADPNPPKNLKRQPKKKEQGLPNMGEAKRPREKFVQNFSMSNTIMQLRKCCNHPYLIEYPTDIDTGDFRIDESLIACSGKLMILDRLLPKLNERGHKVLLFSQMTRMLDILEDYCFMREFRCVRIDGQMGRDDRVESIGSFSTDPDVFIFLLSTRAGGLGINLTAADTVVLYDSDWNPQNDAQAQDRCHRIGQEKPVVVYRLITASTVDQQIVERASKKLALGNMIMHKALFKGNLEKELTGKNKINPEDLLHLLESSKAACNTESKEVITEDELEKLLDRSEMIK